MHTTSDTTTVLISLVEQPAFRETFKVVYNGNTAGYIRRDEEGGWHIIERLDDELAPEDVYRNRQQAALDCCIIWIERNKPKGE